MQPTVIHALEIKCEVCCGCKNPLKLCDGYNKDSWKLSIPRSQAFEWAFDLRQLPSPLVWWAVTCPVSRFDINELGNKAGSAASFSPIMKFLRADIMSWHSVARSAHEGARSPSPGHWKWTCTRHLMAFPVGSMNLLQASRGQFTNWTAISKQTMAMGSMNCHPGDPRLLGAFAEHPEALELCGSWWCYTIYIYLHCGLKRRSAMDQYILHEYMCKLYVHGYG